MTALRFSVDPEDEEVLNRYRAGKAARIVAVGGFISVRHGRRTPVVPTLRG